LIPQLVVMGLGYIGLPTATLIASKGISVLGVDVSQRVVDTLRQGKAHISEPDLEGLIRTVVDKKTLTVNTTPQAAGIFIIAVPTPFKKDKEPDLSYVESAIDMIAPHLRPNDLLIIESTCPVGTTKKMKERILLARPELDQSIFIAYCPERVLPGKILYELEHNDRVIGGVTEEATEKAIQFYRQFVTGQLHGTTARTAEMCKLIENAYRDLNIGFANELSMLCDKVDINPIELIDLANLHPRVNILQPGPGVGGHCIAVDPWFLIYEFPEETELMYKARRVNRYKTEWVIDKIQEAAAQFEKQHGRKAKIACLGLAYKPDIDDLRESPAMEISMMLQHRGEDVVAVEPNIQEAKVKDISIVALNQVLESADLLVPLVSHNQFKGIDWKSLRGEVLDFCAVTSV
jgi:UDP-N-acetyl-D-mannosaminuronic acid dehydrogenase